MSAGYEAYLYAISGSQHEGMHPDDVDNVPMTEDEFNQYIAEQEQAAADDGPYGRIS